MNERGRGTGFSVGRGRRESKCRVLSDRDGCTADNLAGLPAQVLTRVLDFFGVRRAVLLGHDWGAGVGIEYALRKPQRVIGFIGYNISYRDNGGMSKLGQLYRTRGKAKRLLLCWIDSHVHLRKKGKRLAEAAGMELKDCNARGIQSVLEHVIEFLKSLTTDTPR